jgi:galactose-1-phosphate uridylyltransferase
MTQTRIYKLNEHELSQALADYIIKKYQIYPKKRADLSADIDPISHNVIVRVKLKDD